MPPLPAGDQAHERVRTDKNETCEDTGDADEVQPGVAARGGKRAAMSRDCMIRETGLVLLLRNDFFARSCGMGVVALRAVPASSRCLHLLRIVVSYLLMAPGARGCLQPLGMGDALDIGMAIGTEERTMSARPELSLVHIEVPFPFPHLPYLR